MKISVMSLFRDSGDLSVFFDSMDRLEQATDAEFSYFFYENDSVDDTRKVLKDWCMGKPNRYLMYEDVGTPKFGTISHDLRFALMSYYRNTLLKHSSGVLDSEFTLLLDSDVIPESNLVNKAVSCFDDKVAMVTANTVSESISCKMCGCGKPAYYDSLALNDMVGNPSMTWACNPFYRKCDREQWANMQPVEVSRAFSGIALVRTDVLKKCNWHLVQSACEHWRFCDMVRQYGKILAVPYIHAESVLLPSALASLSQSNFDYVSSYQKVILRDHFNSEY